MVDQDTIHLPPPELLALTHALEAMIPLYSQAMDSAKEPPGRYEAPKEGLGAMGLIIRHMESLIVLARTDLVLLPSAFVLIRATFETAIRTQWMLFPRDVFAREARWLVLLKEEEQFLDSCGPKKSSGASRKTILQSFRQQVEANLPPEYRPVPNRLSTFQAMLNEVLLPEAYILYRTLSQYTHGTAYATNLYHHHLGNEMEFGEFINSAEWIACFKIAWFCFRTTGVVVLSEFDVQFDLFLPPLELQRLNDAFQQVDSAYTKGAET